MSPYAFPDIDLHERVSLIFVGPKGQFERMKLAAHPFGKAVSSFDAEKYEKLLKVTQMFKALGWPDYALAPELSEYKAHRQGIVTPNAASFALGEAYFNGDRDQHHGLQRMLERLPDDRRRRLARALILSLAAQQRAAVLGSAHCSWLTLCVQCLSAHTAIVVLALLLPQYTPHPPT